MADLDSLMRVAPLVASGMIGQNQAQEQGMNSLRQQELAQLISSRLQDQSFKAQQQPYELDKLRLGNMNTQQDITTKDWTNKKTAATFDTDVDKTNTKNQMDAYKEVMQHLGSMSNAIQDNPNLPPHVAVSQALKDSGLSQGKTDALMKRYANVPADQLAKRLQEDSDKILRENSAYAQAYDTSALTNDAHILTTGMNNRSAQEVARINAQGKVDAAAEVSARRMMNVDQRIMAAKSARERHQILIDEATKADQAGATQDARLLLQRAEAIRPQAEAELAAIQQKPGQVDVGRMAGVPTTPQQSIAPPAAGGLAPPPATQSGTPGRVSVIGPDGRRGTIPAEQLNQALQQGYKRAQ